MEFRLRLLTAATDDDGGFKRARSIACVRAAAEAFGWTPRPSPNRAAASGDILTGRGFAYSFRSQTVVAQIAEVEVKSFSSCKSLKALVSSASDYATASSFVVGIVSARNWASCRSIAAVIGIPRQSFDAAIKLA